MAHMNAFPYDILKMGFFKTYNTYDRVFIQLFVMTLSHYLNFSS